MKKWLVLFKRGVQRLGKGWKNFRQRLDTRKKTMVSDSIFSHLLIVLQELLETFQSVRGRINRRMRNQYSPQILSSIVTACCGVLVFIALFVPPYCGMANDGTVSQTMKTLGLQYLQDDVSSNYNNYFVRVYQNITPGEGAATLHLWFLRLARALDYLFTRDTLFDVRFAGILYCILYLPAIYLLTKSALERLQFFTESMVVSGAVVLIFADISLLSYFNSLYPEPLILIGVLYLAGAAMKLQKSSGREAGTLILFCVSALVLAFTRKYCFLVCLGAVAFLILFMRVCTVRKYLVLILSGVLLAGGLTSSVMMPDDFTDTSHIHAMTRGVLLQSNNPEKTLEEFNIDGSYALLADVSMYDVMPVSEEENPLLQHGFIDRYTTSDIVLHYMRHPGNYISMLDLGVKSSIDLRRVYCGNYEQSEGLPPRAQSPFWSVYSNYKSRSAPKTIGYLVVLIAAFVLMSGRKSFPSNGEPERFHYVYLLVMTLITFMGVAGLSYIFVRSGDAQLSQFHFLPGVCMDLLLFYILTEILDKLNILEKGKGGS